MSKPTEKKTIFFMDGYTPIKGNMNPTKPPRGGSGVPLNGQSLVRNDSRSKQNLDGNK